MSERKPTTGSWAGDAKALLEMGATQVDADTVRGLLEAFATQALWRESVLPVLANVEKGDAGAYEAGRRDERASVVGWCASNGYEAVAELVERGEHVSASEDV